MGPSLRWGDGPGTASILPLRRSEFQMSRLIVISNRVAAPKPEGEGGAQGGLAVALSAALREYQGLWFGWSGNTVEEFSGEIHFARHEGVSSATIDLEPQDVDEYYNGYANRTLWPLFH